MWYRFLPLLVCSICGGTLTARSFKDVTVEVADEQIARGQLRAIGRDELTKRMEDGVLLCEHCRLQFPVYQTLPIMLPYMTEAHEEFARRYSQALSKVASGYAFPRVEPVEGERFVMGSFSEEWREYGYDGVIWELSYEDFERRFREELGPIEHKPETFLEVGCGLGLNTDLASRSLSVDAVGLDLSFAAMRAATQFRSNPFVQFVQGSAFYPPLRRNHFDIVYSRGVLHHTVSTEKAFASVAPCCRAGGMFYLWIYGDGSIKETPFRRVVYAAELAVRPTLSRNPNSVAARGFLAVAACGYVAFNRLRRWTNSAIQPLSFERGVHAARDRFTPRFAHRHRTEEVVDWFTKQGFRDIVVLDWRTMPAAEQDDFRRNVGVRGSLPRPASN